MPVQIARKMGHSAYRSLSIGDRSGIGSLLYGLRRATIQALSLVQNKASTVVHEHEFGSVESSCDAKMHSTSPCYTSGTILHIITPTADWDVKFDYSYPTRIKQHA